MLNEEKLAQIAVLILNYNSSSLAISNVEQILKFGRYLSIVIVDNCSTDNSVEELQGHFKEVKNVYVLANKNNVGYAAGNNYGIHFICEQLPNVQAILISNPDIYIPCIDIIEAMYSALLQNRTIGAITVQTIYNGKIREPNECCWKYLSISRLLMMSSVTLGRKVKHARYNEFNIDENGVCFVDVVQGCFFMSRAESLLEVNGFDENTFLYGEEQILAKRFNKAGYYNAVLPQYYVQHNHQEKDKRLKSYDAKVEDIHHYFASRKYYVRKYMDCSAIKKVAAECILEIDFQLKKLLLHLR